MGKSKRSQRKPARSFGVVVMMLLAAAVVAGLAYYVKNGPGSSVPDELRKPFDHAMTGQRDDLGSTQRPQPTEIQVPKPVVNEHGEVRFQHGTAEVAAGQDAKVAAVNAFLAVSGIGDPTAKALGVEVSDGTARLDFNEAFQSGMGSMDEAVLIKGLRACLGQFPEIMRIELFVSGKRITDLGHLDLTEPQVVIRPYDWYPTPLGDPPPDQSR